MSGKEAAKISALETQARVALPQREATRGLYRVVPNPSPATPAQREAHLADLHFGVVFTDHLSRATWRAGEGWSDHRVEAYGPIALDPAASVLHYGQEVFEGMKAYKHADGSVWTFRPGFNAARLAHSARRLALPELPVEDFLGSLTSLVAQDVDWIPTTEGASLYLRPFMFASEAFLGVRAARTVDYMCIASPVGPYFSGGFKPVSIWVTQKYHRAGPGGTGDAKTGGNYASSLAPQALAAEKGFEQVCFLDARHGRYLEELGGMNVFVVRENGVVQTPRITGTILEGATRSSIIALLEDRGTTVEQIDIEMETLVADIEAGRVTEMFACGTAAVVVPIGHLAGSGFDVKLAAGKTTASIYETLTGIQMGLVPDSYGWMYRLA